MQVGSYSYDMSRMVFEVATLGYIQTAAQSIVLDYQIFIRNLRYVQIVHVRLQIRLHKYSTLIKTKINLSS